MSLEGARFCARCDQPLLDGEGFDRMPVFSASGPGAIVERHRVCPVTPPPRQTAPVGAPTAARFQ